VVVVRAQSQEWPSGVELTGAVRARTTVEISARVMGYIRELRPRAGDTVTEGQVVAILDSRDLDSASKQAEAAEMEAASGIAEVESAGKAAQAQLDLARATYKRMQDLFSKSSISRQEMDEATARLRVAETAVDAVASKRKQLEARIAQAREAVQLSRVNKAYAEVRAPFSGLVTARKVEPGTLASPGMPLLTVERAGAYRAEITVDESKLREIRSGTPVTVTIESLDRTIEARVTEIVPAIEAESRGFVVKADLPGGISNLRSGLFLRARFQVGGSRRILSIPATAVQDRGQLQSVVVADNGVARERMVRTGEKRGDLIEIVSGLQDGDLIIAQPATATTLKDGDRVEARQQ